MKKELWIEKVVDSAIGTNSLEPSDSLYTKIQERILIAKEYTFTKKQILGIAAAILILISANIVLIAQTNSRKKTTEAKTLVNQFDSSASDNLYAL